MGARGKKSTAALTVVADNPGQRPKPPKELTIEQAEIWTTVAASKPSDWFTPDTHKLLVAYCKHATTAALLDRAIDAFEPEWLLKESGIERYKELTGMREKQTRALTALARSMRLTHQSQYRPESAAANKKTPGKKPWEK